MPLLLLRIFTENRALAVKYLQPHVGLLLYLLQYYFLFFSNCISGVLCGSMVECWTGNPGVLGSSRTGSTESFLGVPFGKTLQSPSIELVKPRKDMNILSCWHDTCTVESGVNPIQSMNQSNCRSSI